MASGFFALLDDIAALMDDVAVMSKVATKKTAGILGDDLAVNAEKASGFVSSREIPVLWAITKGSLLNKLMILPLAFLLSAFAPWIVTIILVLGAIYLAYEGAEKVHEYLTPHHPSENNIETKPLTEAEILLLEKDKIKSAVLTDFILSVEIVIIALGTVLGKPVLNQIIVVTFIAFLATVGVYGIVALIVRMDDLGLALRKRNSTIAQFIGGILIQALPKVIKILAFVGTIALLLVAGGIFVHNIEPLHHFLNSFNLGDILKEFIVGLIGGIIALAIVSLLKKILKKKKSAN
ncbi:MAG: putative DNA repair protein MutK [Flavobacterium sp.]|jgi:predicted DNA repair protein MutK